MLPAEEKKHPSTRAARGMAITRIMTTLLQMTELRKTGKIDVTVVMRSSTSLIQTKTSDLQTTPDSYRSLTLTKALVVSTASSRITLLQIVLVE